MNRARAHHYVPQCYLQQWADGGIVAVRRRGSAQAFTPSIRRVAQQTDLYTIDGADGPSDEVERELAEFEGELPGMLRSLATGHIPDRGSAVRVRYAALLGLQFVRTPDRMELYTLPGDALKLADGETPVPRGTIRQLLESQGGYEPSPSELQGAWDFVNYVVMNDQGLSRHDYLEIQFSTLPRIAEHLSALSWSVEIAKVHPFLTSDQPLNLWVRRPRPGVGVGLANAEEIRFPLSPHQLLVLKPHGSDGRHLVPRRRVDQVNLHLAATCRHMIIARKQDVIVLEAIALRSKRPMWKFNEGPVYVKGADGQAERADGEVLHFYRPYDDQESAI